MISGSQGQGPKGGRWRAGVRRAGLYTGGVFLVTAGLAAAAYAAFSIYERSRSGDDADRFSFEASPEAVAGWYVPYSTATGVTPPATPGRDPVPTSTSQAATSPSGAYVPSGLFPGDRFNPRFWGDPVWAGGAPFGVPGLPEGFEPVSAAEVVLSPFLTGQAVSMHIGAIALDSAVYPLEILDLADQREYATPVNTVGFIPETAAPGQGGRGWYFGHLESFVRGEGNVFGRLPEVADLVRHDPVDIIVSTAGAEYLYRVTATKQVHQRDLIVETDGPSGITLVTCWPPRVYDQRVVVYADLIAVRVTV